ncbi:hypothetical protein Tco_0674760 [Tanacetum coccineum]
MASGLEVAAPGCVGVGNKGGLLALTAVATPTERALKKRDPPELVPAFVAVPDIVDAWSSKRASVTRANAKASPNVVGLATNNSRYCGSSDVSEPKVIENQKSCLLRTSAVTYTSVFTNLSRRAFWGCDEEVISEGGLEDPKDTTSSSGRGCVRAMFSNPEEDPKEYKDDETKDGPVDHPMDGGDDRDDDNSDSSGDDTDGEDEEDEDEEEEEEHLAPADLYCLYLWIYCSGLRLPYPSPEAVGESLLGAKPTAHSSPPPMLRRGDMELEMLGTVLVILRRIGKAVLEIVTYDCVRGVDMDSQRVDLLIGGLMTLQEEQYGGGGGAYTSRGAWAHLIGLVRRSSGASDTRDHVYATREPIQDTDTATATEYSHSDTTSETLRVIKDMRREMSDMQAELLALREQRRRARQPGLEARTPDHQNASGDADSIVGLTRWIEKMESVFNISGCAIENQVKFATYTLLGSALTWWNGQIRTLAVEPKSQGERYSAYTERFQELTLICTKFAANETEKVDKYISGLPDNIYGNVKSAKHQEWTRDY